eukprot:scaffold169204_cov24-Tisochrysis_lutea.AAC.1
MPLDAWTLLLLISTSAPPALLWKMQVLSSVTEFVIRDNHMGEVTTWDHTGVWWHSGGDAVHETIKQQKAIGK